MYYNFLSEYDINIESLSLPKWRQALELCSLAGAGIVNLPPGDHDFRGATYQALLSRNIKAIRNAVRKREL